MFAQNVFVKEIIIEKNMFFNDVLLLKYTIKYPQFISELFSTSLRRINLFYKMKALLYEKVDIQKLYQMAKEEYDLSKVNDFPFRQFEAYMDYEITYNQNCTISLYFDRYEYTGGAHGNTIRSADTWDLETGIRIELSEMFPYVVDYQEYIFENIFAQINAQINAGNNIYFDNYHELVEETFMKDNYYLTEEGVVIYFQHYDIAPYSSGIPTFTIPYSDEGAIEPNCSN